MLARTVTKFLGPVSKDTFPAFFCYHRENVIHLFQVFAKMAEDADQYIAAHSRENAPVRIEDPHDVAILATHHSPLQVGRSFKEKPKQIFLK